MRHLYFAQRLDDMGLIKIGASAHLSQRLRQLEKQARCPMNLLASLPVPLRCEPRVHALLAGARVAELGREWFRPTAGVLAFVSFAREFSDGEILDAFVGLQLADACVEARSYVVPSRLLMVEEKRMVCRAIRGDEAPMGSGYRLVGRPREDSQVASEAIIERLTVISRNASWLARELGVSRQRVSQQMQREYVTRTFAERVAPLLWPHNDAIPLAKLFELSVGEEAEEKVAKEAVA